MFPNFLDDVQQERDTAAVLAACEFRLGPGGCRRGRARPLSLRIGVAGHTIPQHEVHMLGVVRYATTLARPHMRLIALLIFGGSIVAANWLIRNVGTTTLPDGTHLVPVGFGLMAPSGVYAAGATFVARDILQRIAGHRWAVGAILAGTVLSVLVSPPLALASGMAFLFSELADFAVYTPLQRERFVLAVVASGIVGSIVDSILFLQVAGIPLAVALPGLVLGKLWVQLFAAPLAAWLRTRLPERGSVTALETVVTPSAGTG
jgi:queuosine precursor transporter